MADTITPTIKPGWQTTEFWTSIITAIMGFGIISGYLLPAEATKLLGGWQQAVGGVMSVVSVAAYAISRGRAKQNPVDFNALLAALAAQVPPPKE